MGLFRLPGRSTRVRELKGAFNTGELDLSCTSLFLLDLSSYLYLLSFSVPFALTGAAQHPDVTSEEIHVVASLLKQYLRELPEPLMTYANFTPCLEAAKRTCLLPASTSALSTYIHSYPST